MKLQALFAGGGADLGAEAWLRQVSLPQSSRMKHLNNAFRFYEAC